MLERRDSGPGWRDVLRAQVAILRSAWAVRTSETGGLLSLVPGREEESVAEPTIAEHPDTRADTPASSNSADLAEARRIGDAVRFVASRGLIRPRCLVRALALKRLLDQRGIDGARIRIGVKRDSGTFMAHAWVEYHGHVVGDYPERVREYDDLRGLRVGEGAGDDAGSEAP